MYWCVIKVVYASCEVCCLRSSSIKHTNVGSHISSAEDMEFQIQEDIRKLTKKRRTRQPQQSDMSIVYDVTTGK